MKNRWWIWAFLFVIYLTSIQGNCKHEGKLVKRGYKYFTADCQKCTCRKKNKFVCISACRKRKLPECQNTFVKNVTVRGTNCTCPVIKCSRNQPDISTTAAPTTLAAVAPDGKQFHLHLIIIIVALVIVLVVIVIVALLWRCRSTNTGFWKSVSQHEGRNNKKRWSMTKRPLPNVPLESSTLNASTCSLHHHGNDDNLKSSHQNHVTKSVPNPYVTTAHAQKNKNASNKTYSYPNVAEINPPPSIDNNGQHYQELDAIRSESITYEVPNDSSDMIYTVLNDDNDDNDYCNQPLSSSSSSLNQDYLQPT